MKEREGETESDMHEMGRMGIHDHTYELTCVHVRSTVSRAHEWSHPVVSGRLSTQVEHCELSARVEHTSCAFTRTMAGPY